MAEPASTLTKPTLKPANGQQWPANPDGFLPRFLHGTRASFVTRGQSHLESLSVRGEQHTKCSRSALPEGCRRGRTDSGQRQDTGSLTCAPLLPGTPCGLLRTRHGGCPPKGPSVWGGGGERGSGRRRMPWGFVFFFQKPSSKSFEEELGNVGSNPGSDLGQDPGLSFPIRKRSRLDFLMVEGPFWLHFPRAKGTRTQLTGC